jgi:hypothetical protein
MSTYQNSKFKNEANKITINQSTSMIFKVGIPSLGQPFFIVVQASRAFRFWLWDF